MHIDLHSTTLTLTHSLQQKRHKTSIWWEGDYLCVLLENGLTPAILLDNSFIFYNNIIINKTKQVHKYSYALL